MYVIERNPKERQIRVASTKTLVTFCTISQRDMSIYINYGSADDKLRIMNQLTCKWRNDATMNRLYLRRQNDTKIRDDHAHCMAVLEVIANKITTAINAAPKCCDCGCFVKHDEAVQDSEGRIASIDCADAAVEANTDPIHDKTH